MTPSSLHPSPVRPTAGPQRVVEVISRLTLPLSVAITALLFVQWPLRDLVGAWSTQANDLAQALFALYVAVAVTHAGVRRSHLVARPDLAEPLRATRWRRIGAPLCVLPWAGYVIVVSAPAAWSSSFARESFPESMNPGYFVLRIALLLLALLLATQSVLDLWRVLRR